MSGEDNYTNIQCSDEDGLVLQAQCYLHGFPPTHYVLLLGAAYLEFLMDRAVLVLLSFLAGALSLLGLQAALLYKLYSRAAPQPPPQFSPADVRLPDVLKSRLGDDLRSKKEDGTWFNFFLQFMFSELQDSLQLRRFLTKKIQTEFEEILRSRSGILVDELYLRDFNLGDNFPVFMGISVDKSDVVSGVIQTLDIRARIMYDGGFQIAVDAALPFGRVAFVSVRVLKVRGLLRFRFSRHPFSHWSISFYEEPEIDLDVSAQLDGRPMHKLKGIFASQIRRLIRKKHTLPMYKMRFKPFFLPHVDTERSSGQSIRVDGVEVGHGVFEVTIKGASRLRFITKGAYFYCTASVDELPWKQKVAEERKKREIVTVQLVKVSADQSLGMTVKDELLPDRLYPVVVIEGIIVGMPAHLANLKDGEILVGISGTKVFSAKEAMKSLKWTKENKIEIQIERRQIHQEASDDMSVHSKSSDPSDDSPKLVTRSLPPSTQNSDDSIEGSSKLTGSSRKTMSMPACENPTWNQKFIFTVDPSLHYLNVCLWSKGGNYSGTSEVLKSAKHDVLVGYASLNLDDIYLHCLITLNGSLSDRVKLKHGHYKTEAELIKEWSVHKGWDPNQMYGDLSLGFHFHPTQLTPKQRQGLASCRATSSKAGLDSFLMHKDVMKAAGAAGASSSDDRKGRAQHADRSEKVGFSSEVDDKREQHEGHHQFDSTTFISATFCDYCGRKIWMKDAFKCRTCSMVCHKKCLVKCLVNTVCTESGVRKRDAEDEVWKPLQAPGKLAANTVRVDYEGHKPAKEEEIDLDVMEDTLSPDRLSAHNLSSLLEVIYTPGPESGSRHTQRLRSESMPEVGQHGRFRNLKEQTDRMKDNVLKHLRRTKMPAALNDKAIHSAKQAGAQLFADMDPLLRKDKLEEMVRKLDDQLILEMQNKESLEQQLAVLETEQLSAETGRTSPSSSPQHWAAPSSSTNRSKEVKALHQRLDKSGEKVDALRLLMLQYCSGLQNCINSLEIEDGEGRSVDPDGNGSGSPANGTSNSPSPPSVVSESAATAANFSDDTDSPKTERKRSAFGGMSQGVGGFVRRASSSVKEKMSSFKEFGRKTTSKAATPGRALDQPESSQEMLQIVTTSERNNSGLNPIVESGEPVQVPTLQRNARSKSDGQVENFVRLAETPSLKSSSTLEINNPAVSSLLEGPHLVNNGSRDTNDVPYDTRRASKYPEVEIHVENADSSNSHAERERPRKRKVKSDEPKHLLREALEDGHQILRSRSDSNLDLTMDASRLSPGAGAGRKHGPGRGAHKKTDPIRGSNQLSPKHILAYRGSSSSLPQLVAHDDSDSDCSDYVVIDTSEDEARHSDSTSEYDYDDDDGELDAVTDVTFEGDPRVVAPGSGVDVEDEEGTPDHRAIIQHLHTYQV